MQDAIEYATSMPDAVEQFEEPSSTPNLDVYAKKHV